MIESHRTSAVPPPASVRVSLENFEADWGPSYIFAVVFFENDAALREAGPGAADICSSTLESLAHFWDLFRDFRG